MRPGARDELVIAALFHDIGQIIPLDSTKEVRMNLRGSTENVGRVGHEAIGAAYLKSLGFSETVCRLVNSHVAAKRYFSLQPFNPNSHRSYCSIDISRPWIVPITTRYHPRRKNRSLSRVAPSWGRSFKNSIKTRYVMRWFLCDRGMTRPNWKEWSRPRLELGRIWISSLPIFLERGDKLETPPEHGGRDHNSLCRP